MSRAVSARIFYVRQISDAELVTAAASGDEAAWSTLVSRYLNLVWSVPVQMGLSDADAAEVVQLTWTRLFGSIDGLAHPDRVRFWLRTTARRESWRHFRNANRSVPVGAESWLFDTVEPNSDPAHIVTNAAKDEVLLSAFDRLDDESQEFLLLLLREPPATYAELAEIFRMSPDSVGSRRQRILSRLKSLYETMEARSLRGVHADV